MDYTKLSDADVLHCNLSANNSTLNVKWEKKIFKIRDYSYSSVSCHMIHNFDNQTISIQNFELSDNRMIAIDTMSLECIQQIHNYSAYAIQIMLERKDVHPHHIKQQIIMRTAINVDNNGYYYFMVKLDEYPSILSLDKKQFNVFTSIKQYEIIQYTLFNVIRTKYNIIIPNEIISFIFHDCCTEYFWSLGEPVLCDTLQIINIENIISKLPTNLQGDSTIIDAPISNAYFIESNKPKQLQPCNINGVGIVIKMKDESDECLMDISSYPKLCQVLQQYEIGMNLTAIWCLDNVSVLFKINALQHSVRNIVLKYGYNIDVMVEIKVLLDVKSIDERDMVLWLNWWHSTDLGVLWKEMYHLWFEDLFIYFGFSRRNSCYDDSISKHQERERRKALKMQQYKQISKRKFNSKISRRNKYSNKNKKHFCYR